MTIWMIGFTFTFGIYLNEDNRSESVLKTIGLTLFMFIGWPLILGMMASDVAKAVTGRSKA